ncbi:CPBP family intramembrane metalloprotease [Natronomonas halophila]|uniref:CPBP family intramembrane glutamic endopeptidase n=1 Tax=Natronomonas halophila TaxID=2747817 RepID=UPI0015B5459B|nr:CPBP family intramembrane glutamic endopeptidase [Natronomonas halophila]QLD86602.1 CPBP family intramembrane metalloprotease [Natronomonas halophila]
MRKPSIRTVLRDENQRLRWPFRLVWNDTDRRPQLLIRLTLAFALFIALAGAGNQFRPTLLSGDTPLVRTINMLGRQLPNAVGLALATVIAALVIDRRRLTDFGLRIDQGWWHGIVGGTILGAGITLLSIVIGLRMGYYEFAGTVRTHRPLVWPFLAAGGAVFQLIFVVPEELFVRGYLITNVTEDLDSVQRIPRWVAVGIGILASSGVFYLTHAAGKGTTYGGMAGGISILLGLAYVFSGDLSVPIGIHFGFNFAGVLAGTNVQPASLLRLTSSTTIQESIALPVEAVFVRLVGAVLGIGLLVAWYHAVRGPLRVAPTLHCPTLRWKPTDDTLDE